MPTRQLANSPAPREDLTASRQLDGNEFGEGRRLAEPSPNSVPEPLRCAYDAGTRWPTLVGGSTFRAANTVYLLLEQALPFSADPARGLVRPKS